MKKQQDDPELEAILRIQQDEEEADRRKYEDGDDDDFDEEDLNGARNPR